MSANPNLAPASRAERAAEAATPWGQFCEEVYEYGGAVCGRVYRASIVMSEPTQMAVERMTARALATAIDKLRAHPDASMGRDEGVEADRSEGQAQAARQGDAAPAAATPSRPALARREPLSLDTDHLDRDADGNADEDDGAAA